MCGICGVFSKETVNQEDEKRVRVMTSVINHRGPDGEGYYHGQYLSMGMRRLSIIDLVGGWQPLYNEDHSLALIANGEIYNYIELRQNLQKKGHILQTQGDCETILHLYEEYGPECVHYLRGMFAFALWDEKRQQLFLGRDRMGEKPLYIYQTKDKFVFASEIKALLRSGLVPFELDPISVNLYFHYAFVPEPRTILKGVRKLDAASYLLIGVASGQVKEKVYWKMEDCEPLEGDPVKIIRQELEKVSELIVRSDVPVGVALSGGIDSGAVAALTVQKYPGVLHAFSVGYPGCASYDERPQARELAQILEIPFHEIEIRTEDIVSLFPKLDYYRDDPIADIAGYGYYFVSQSAHENQVPVMLQGQGGDELFWYPWIIQALHLSTSKQRLVEGGMLSFLKYVTQESGFGNYHTWLKSNIGLLTGLGKYNEIKNASVDQMIFWDMSPKFSIAQRNIKKLLTPQFNALLIGTNPCQSFTSAHPWPFLPVHFTKMICDLYLRENGIAQGDRLSMASSVELRLPLVDYRLVETVIGLRKTYPDDQLAPKTWLKKAVQDLLPPKWFNFPKQGFTPPVNEWLFALLKQYSPLISGGYLVDSKIINPHSGDQLMNSPDIWLSLAYETLVLENWCRSMQ